jgi:hypothetical protein
MALYRRWSSMTAAQTFGVREAPPPFRQFSDDHKARVVSEAMMGGLETS